LQKRAIVHLFTYSLLPILLTAHIPVILLTAKGGNLASPADATKTMKGMLAYFEVPAGAAARIVFDECQTELR